MPTKLIVTYRARLCGRGGELDNIAAKSLELLANRLGHKLVNKDWLLADGDAIHIDSDVEE